jgi:N-acyl-phosphatidylethanolamine-hydrolysing phospholipase D
VSGGGARRLLVLAAIALSLCSSGAARAGEPEAPMTRSLYAPHVEGRRFFNPWGPQSIGGLVDVLKWQLFSRNPYDKSGPLAVPRVANDGASLAGVEHSATVTWVGHATFAVHDEGDVFLTDPHFGNRALFPRRLMPPGIPIESVPANAFAVLSHNHYDHLDAWTVAKLPAAMPWFVPLGLGEWFRKRGRTNVVELDWWQSAQHGRFTITCLPAQHWSRRIEQGTNATLWCSWLVDSGLRKYFFAGDTGYFPGFAEYGRRFGPIDVAMLPIGAYEPRWFMQYQHMDPADAYQAFLDLRARTMIGMHWGTFDLTDEPADLPPRVLADVVKQAGGDASRAIVLAIGEQWHVPKSGAVEAAAAR